MAGLSCAQVRGSTAELALGILPAGERRAVEAHLASCRGCLDEVAAFSALGGQLLELVPDTEPPLGFDRAVLDRLAPRRRRPSRVAAVLAAVAAVTVACGVGVALTRHSPHPAAPDQAAATLLSGGKAVGTVYEEGHPAWIWMTVRDGSVSGQVRCQVVQADGTVSTVGSFDLVRGTGSWGAPEPAGLHGVVAARLVDASGRVLASAPLRVIP